ncbi:MAG: class I SAM-dependent methyltransferase [Polyangiaceae bacterium]|nr:class I SAM-dependent methyltransferase [Polyangiaceae bacterium]
MATRVRSKLRSEVRRRVQGLEGIESVSRNPEFEVLRSQIRAAGTDKLSHFANGYVREGGLSLQQNPDEFAALCIALAGCKPIRNYLEIGSASGGACRFLHEYLHFDRVFVLDDGQHPRASEQEANFREIKPLERFIGDSHSQDARRFLAQRVEGTLDVAFIDGDHSYEGAAADLRLVSAFSRPGTLVIFHDTVACEGVRNVWQRSMRTGMIKGVAEFVGDQAPLGIGVGQMQ